MRRSIDSAPVATLSLFVSSLVAKQAIDPRTIRRRNSGSRSPSFRVDVTPHNYLFIFRVRAY